MKRLFPYLLLGFMPLIGCNDGPANPDDIAGDGNAAEDIVEFSESDSELAAQVQNFNIDFFRAANKVTREDENVLVSPLSASVYLSMLANAATEEAAAEIAEVLGCSDRDALNGLSYKYLTLLPVIDESTTMSFANSLWYQRDYSLNPSFEKILGEYFDTELFPRQLQTNNSGVVQEINGWVSDNTESLIDKIIDSIPYGTVSILINAIYFKGAWANPFDADETEEKDFYGIDGVATVDMMCHSGYQHYRSMEQFELVKMEFGEGAFEALMLLPKENVSLDEILESDALYSLNKMAYTDQSIDLLFPKFKLEPKEMGLNKVLADIGVEMIMASNQYSIFTQEVTSTINVRQKSVIEFTEEGAEGASVTWDLCGSSSFDSDAVSRRPIVNFNRPFMFFINETNTGAMLFAGKVVKL
ncbi:MAG: hypothetical protein J1F05_01895 [Muribaculaceae bacterium]|nr:hypothetical protein [Muribaculaceae bacterium]